MAQQIQRTDAQIIMRDGNRIITRPTGEIGQTPMAVIALDLMEEIADRLASIEELVRRERGSGQIRQYDFAADGPVQVQVSDSTLRWVSVSIVNDGPNDVFIYAVDPHEDHPVMLKMSEKLDIDFKQDVQAMVYVACRSGQTASGRIFAKV